MKECLSAKPDKSVETAQQEKMKAGNKEAGEKSLKGDERKKFMSTCLSNYLQYSGAAPAAPDQSFPIDPGNRRSAHGVLLTNLKLTLQRKS